MTVFVSDTFTDADGTLLTAHTGETGATWTSLKGTAEEIQSNALTPNGNDAVCYASGSPASAEYDVEYVVTGTPASGAGLGGAGRLDTGVSTGTYYLAWTNGTNYTLYKVVANSFTSLGSSSGITPAAGDTVKLELRDAAKKIFINGTERISSADNAITGAGKAGVRSYGNVTTVGIDTFVATDAGGSDLNITGILGSAAADGFTASVDRQFAVAGTLGAATANGFTANVDRQLTVSGTLGTATADGFLANVDRQLSISGVIGAATADGFAANVDRQYAVAGTLGAAIGDGFTADITLGSDLNITGIQGVATAAGFNANIDDQISISGSLGQALADGFLANIDQQHTIASALGTATASGFDAQIDRQYAVTGILGTATADGFTAGVDQQYTVAGIIGTATAEGYTATIEMAGLSLFNTVYKSAAFTVSANKSAEFTVAAASRTARF